MRLPYLLRRMCRRKKMCFAVCIMGFAVSALLYGFRMGDLSMDRQIEDVLDNAVVTCAVTNLTGTQSDYLELVDWTVNLFRETDADSIHVPETSFLDYLEDIQMKLSTGGELSGQSVNVVGVNTLRADHSLRPEEDRIFWFEGYDETIFSQAEALCIVSEDLYQGLEPGDSADREITLKIQGEYDEEKVTELKLTVAGTCSGKQATIYCPWSIAEDAYRSVNLFFGADCIYATIIDNRRIEEFKERCAREYFAEVDPKGVPQPWEKSPLYDSYPYAFAVYDETMNLTVESLRQNQSIYRLCQKIIVVLTLGMGFIIGNLSTKQRQRELALQYVLGLPRGRIFTEVWVEHLIVCGAGTALATLVFLAISGISPPWGYLLGAFGANCLGVAAALLPVLIHDDILQVVKRGD